MKRVLLLIVVTALLGALGLAQTPAASPTPDQINTPIVAAPAPAPRATAPAETAVPPAAPAAAATRITNIRPGRLSDAARLSLVLWSRLFDWKEALANRHFYDFRPLASQEIQVVLASEIAG